MSEELPFVDILLPIPIARRFTYRVPAEWLGTLQRGTRVVVPFGKRRILTGIVDQIGVPAPNKYEARYLLDILDDRPVLTDPQFRLIDWMSHYYMCQPGDVLQAMLPAGLKISSTSYVQLHPDRDKHTFDRIEIQRLADALEVNESLSYEEARDILDVSNPFTVLQHLVRDGIVIVFDQVKERFTPRVERHLQLHPDFSDSPEQRLQDAFEKLHRAPKQEDALMAFLQEISDDEGVAQYERSVPKKILAQKEVSDSALKGLLDKKILESIDKRIGRFPSIARTASPPELSDAQTIAKEKILEIFSSKDVALLHGVTGSGKTEVYIHLIQQLIDQGQQVLYLLPEIALTTQIVQRLRTVFGDSLGVYHSKFSDNERVEVWQGILQNRFQVIVGVRSAVFLPFNDLGLIIIDEEHEHSFKQHEPAPRYHARDTAMMLARFHHAKVLMGTATPAIETMYLANSGQFGYVPLTQRYGEAILPEIQLVDALRSMRKKQMQGPFTQELVEAMKETLNKGEQIILFQNRRGYAPYLSCNTCNFVPQCVNCDVSLTYHQFSQALICHYCGSREPVPHTCEACGSHAFQTMGIGTEKLEEEVQLLFPQTRVQRMDLDSTRGKNSFERILQDFSEGQMDVLVGTQMVAKGLDFGNVGLVGIIDLDSLMNYPDFRSYERTFQLGVQVGGRAGRGSNRGKVIIQTRKPDHPIVQLIKQTNYPAFYEAELQERTLYKYPPFMRLIRIVLKHRDRQVASEAGMQLATLYRQSLGDRILGPQEPVVNRIRNEFIMEVWVKIERANADREKIKYYLFQQGEILRNQKLFRNLKISYNVDPY